MNQPLAWLIIKGIATYIPKLYDSYPHKEIGFPANYYYSIWLRHFITANKFKKSLQIKNIVEIGPGESLGSGLAGILTGAQSLTALDEISNINYQKNIKVLNGLIKLFKNKAPIPENDFPDILPKLDSYQFPNNLISDQKLARLLNKRRIKQIKQALKGEESPIKIKHIIGWNETSIKRNSIDFIFSQAVMEHVENIDKSYSSFSKWLKPGGLTAHQIDFKCHRLSKNWDGHWAYKDWLWKFLKGKRGFLINRLPYSEHMRSIRQAQLRLYAKILYKSKPLSKKIFVPHKKLDREISGAYLLAEKR